MNPNLLTKYEISRLIGSRSEMLSHGAPPCVDINGLINPIDIAWKEFKEKKLPLTVERTYPNGTVEIVDPNKCEYLKQ